MGSRNRFKPSQRAKTKPERKAVEYTTSAGRGKNRVEVKAKPTVTKTRKEKEDQYNRAVKTAKETVKSTPPKVTPPKVTPPKVTPPKVTPPKVTPSTKVSSPKKDTPKKPAATSSKKLTPMQQWAKAHPELAKKVKKGQSGAKELKIGRSTKKRSWLDKNYKPGK